MTAGIGMSHFYKVITRETAWKRRNLEYYLSRLFKGVDVSGKSMLDIGAGDGVFSLYAASAGASRAVALEPEAAGASSGAQARFARMRDDLGLSNAEMKTCTFQELDVADRFDVVLLHNSINHLDEPACIDLHRDAAAWAVYRDLFQRLADLMNSGGKLIIADCSRHNFFAHLGVKNPMARSIEWHKHQPPELWARLAGEAGFRNPDISWKSFSPLGSVGRVFLANKVVAYFIFSHFRLLMDKA